MLNSKGSPGAALPGHLVAIEGGNDRGGFSGIFTRMDVVDPPNIDP